MKKNSEQVFNLSHYILLLKGGAIIQKFCRENQKIIEKVKQQTLFLPSSAGLIQRAFCIQNNITSIPVCSLCKKTTKWSTTHRNFRMHCSPYCYSKDINVTKRRRKTNLLKYGVDNPYKLKTIQEKQKQTNLLKYGVTCSVQRHLSTENIKKLLNKEWLCEQHHCKKRSISDISSELGITVAGLCYRFKKFKININYITGFSFKCSQWLDEIILKQNIFIQHIHNSSGEFVIPNTKMRVDGYCQQTNTIYEFYGDYFHGNPKIYDEMFMTFFHKTAGELYKQTLKRENIIKSLGYNLVTIWESKWKEIYEKTT